MTGTKGLLESKTIIGVLVGMACRALLAYCGLEITEDIQAEIAIWAATAVGVAGDGWAIYGRIKATHRIGPGGGSIGAALFILGLLPFLLVGCAGAQQQLEEFGPKECYAAVEAANGAIEEVFAATLDLFVADIIDDKTALRLHKASRRAGSFIDRAERLCPTDSRTARNLIAEAQGMVAELQHQQDGYHGKR